MILLKPIGITEYTPEMLRFHHAAFNTTASSAEELIRESNIKDNIAVEIRMHPQGFRVPIFYNMKSVER